MILKCLVFVFFSVMTAAVFAQTPSIETGVSQSLAKWRSANYSDVRYKLNITLEKGAPLMRGEIEISVTLTDEGARNDLILDWRTTQFAADKDKPFADVVSVNQTVMGKATQSSTYDYQTTKEHLLISHRFFKTGENTIKINFASPIKTSGAAVTRYVDKEDNAEYVYSLFVPSDASTAFPVFDQPDLKARFLLHAIVPPNWKMVSNMPGKFFTCDGCDGDYVPDSPIYSFEETKPISTYVFAFAAGEFAEFPEVDKSKQDEIPKKSKLDSDEAPVINVDSKSGSIDPNINPSDIENLPNFKQNQKEESKSNALPDVPMKIYVRQSQAEKFKQHSAEVFRLNREGVKFLEDWFDYKFPFPKYDLVLLPEFPFGGMEHAGATFLREDRVIFPTEPTKNDYITRANVIFHEAAHQWFGDTVTMKWFDDLWLKEGFAEFMAYKTLEKVMPEYNAWKIFYERNKQAAYLTDVTRGTTPIYQEISNLSSAKSAYGNIVYRKAPSFLRQAEFYLGEDKFQTAVRAFLKKHEFANASWQDLVKEIEEVKLAEVKKSDYYQKVSDKDKHELESFTRWQINTEWANYWINASGMPTYRISPNVFEGSTLNVSGGATGGHTLLMTYFTQKGSIENFNWLQNIRVLKVYDNGEREEATADLGNRRYAALPDEEAELIKNGFKRDEFTFSEAFKNLDKDKKPEKVKNPLFVFPNYQDYGYGIFLLDEQSRAYVLENIQNEKDDFLRSMMWGSLWDSVRFYELAPEDYVKLVIKNINTETDESTIATLLNRVSTAMNYYLSDAQAAQFAPEIETLLIDKMQNAPTLGEKITYYRAFVVLASSENARNLLKAALADSGINTAKNSDYKQRTVKREAAAVYKIFPPLKTKDKFDIMTKLIALGDADGLQLLAELEKTETDDAAKRYAYAARAGIPTAENKLKYWKDFTENKELSESYIEAAFAVWNTTRHSDLTLPYLEKALAELPNLKKNRKIFFVNNWLAAFIGGQKSAEALAVINKFLEKNPDLDKDLQRKILENADNLERAVKIREKFGR